MRREYLTGGLTEADAGDDPLDLFDRWFNDAREKCPGPWYEANAMALATVDRAGVPSNRIVLLKDYNASGLTFFTNYQSRKAADLADRPTAAAVFHWAWLERQVRVTGPVAQVSRQVSEAYFASRPRGSQLGAWVSNQSEPMSRQQMADRLIDVETRFADTDVPTPPHWGGYVIEPTQVEFWQGRENRLHDRLLYTRQSPAAPWQRQRLGP